MEWMILAYLCWVEFVLQIAFMQDFEFHDIHVIWMKLVTSITTLKIPGPNVS